MLARPVFRNDWIAVARFGKREKNPRETIARPAAPATAGTDAIAGVATRPAGRAVTATGGRPEALGMKLLAKEATPPMFWKAGKELPLKISPTLPTKPPMSKAMFCPPLAIRGVGGGRLTAAVAKSAAVFSAREAAGVKKAELATLNVVSRAALWILPIFGCEIARAVFTEPATGPNLATFTASLSTLIFGMALASLTIPPEPTARSSALPTFLNVLINPEKKPMHQTLLNLASGSGRIGNFEDG